MMAIVLGFGETSWASVWIATLGRQIDGWDCPEGIFKFLEPDQWGFRRSGDVGDLVFFSEWVRGPASVRWHRAPG